MVTLNIGLSPWILSDGNYRDFSPGDERKFALEFHGPELHPVQTAGVPSLESIRGARYSAVGRIAFVYPEVWVVDFGIVMAYDDDPPSWATVGVQVSGAIYVGIDPFHYFERYHALPGMPALTYQFRVIRIFEEEIAVVGLELDYSRTTEREINTTRPQPPFRDPYDRSSTNHFVLDCELLNGGLSPVVDMG